MSAALGGRAGAAAHFLAALSRLWLLPADNNLLTECETNRAMDAWFGNGPFPNRGSGGDEKSPNQGRASTAASLMTAVSLRCSGVATGVSSPQIADDRRRDRSEEWSRWGLAWLSGQNASTLEALQNAAAQELSAAPDRPGPAPDRLHPFFRRIATWEGRATSMADSWRASGRVSGCPGFAWRLCVGRAFSHPPERERLA